MESMAKGAIAAVAGPKIAKHFKFSWLVYGAIAYLGLRYLHKKGVLPRQTGMALNAIDRGIDTAKERVGIKSRREPPKDTHTVH